MGGRISMSISVDSPDDETLNHALALLLRRQYEFPSGINDSANFTFILNFYSQLDSILDSSPTSVSKFATPSCLASLRLCIKSG